MDKNNSEKRNSWKRAFHLLKCVALRKFRLKYVEYLNKIEQDLKQKSEQVFKEKVLYARINPRDKYKQKDYVTIINLNDLVSLNTFHEQLLKSEKSDNIKVNDNLDLDKLGESLISSILNEIKSRSSCLSSSTPNSAITDKSSLSSKSISNINFISEKFTDSSLEEQEEVDLNDDNKQIEEQENQDSIYYKIIDLDQEKEIKKEDILISRPNKLEANSNIKKLNQNIKKYQNPLIQLDKLNNKSNSTKEKKDLKPKQQDEHIKQEKKSKTKQLDKPKVISKANNITNKTKPKQKLSNNEAFNNKKNTKIKTPVENIIDISQQNNADKDLNENNLKIHKPLLEPIIESHLETVNIHLPLIEVDQNDYEIKNEDSLDESTILDDINNLEQQQQQQHEATNLNNQNLNEFDIEQKEMNLDFLDQTINGQKSNDNLEIIDEKYDLDGEKNTLIEQDQIEQFIALDQQQEFTSTPEITNDTILEQDLSLFDQEEQKPINNILNDFKDLDEFKQNTNIDSEEEEAELTNKQLEELNHDENIEEKELFDDPSLSQEENDELFRNTSQNSRSSLSRSSSSTSFNESQSEKTPVQKKRFKSFVKRKLSPILFTIRRLSQPKLKLKQQELNDDKTRTESDSKNNTTQNQIDFRLKLLYTPSVDTPSPLKLDNENLENNLNNQEQIDSSKKYPKLKALKYNTSFIKISNHLNTFLFKLN